MARKNSNRKIDGIPVGKYVPRKDGGKKPTKVVRGGK